MSTKHLQLTFRRFVARQIIEPFYAMTSISPSSGLQSGDELLKKRLALSFVQCNDGHGFTLKRRAKVGGAGRKFS